MHKKLIILLFMIWFFIFFILPFFSKTIGSDINKIYSVLIFIFLHPIYRISSSLKNIPLQLKIKLPRLY